MKKFFATLLSIMLLVTSLSVSMSAASTNLVPNGDASDGINGWNAWKAAETSNFEVENGTFKASTVDAPIVLWSTPVAATAGEEFIVSFKYKLVNAPNSTITVRQFKNGDGTNLELDLPTMNVAPTNDGAWHSYATVVVASDKGQTPVTGIGLSLTILDANATVYFDDVVIVKRTDMVSEVPDEPDQPNEPDQPENPGTTDTMSLAVTVSAMAVAVLFVTKKSKKK